MALRLLRTVGALFAGLALVHRHFMPQVFQASSALDLIAVSTLVISSGEWPRVG
jgi:hypothetical protein